MQSQVSTGSGILSGQQSVAHNGVGSLLEGNVFLGYFDKYHVWEAWSVFPPGNGLVAKLSVF